MNRPTLLRCNLSVYPSQQTRCLLMNREAWNARCDNDAMAWTERSLAAGALSRRASAPSARQSSACDPGLKAVMAGDHLQP